MAGAIGRAGARPTGALRVVSEPVRTRLVVIASHLIGDGDDEITDDGEPDGGTMSRPVPPPQMGGS
jgi:hypothetical protein